MLWDLLFHQDGSWPTHHLSVRLTESILKTIFCYEKSTFWWNIFFMTFDCCTRNILNFWGKLEHLKPENFLVFSQNSNNFYSEFYAFIFLNGSYSSMGHRNTSLMVHYCDGITNKGDWRASQEILSSHHFYGRKWKHEASMQGILIRNQSIISKRFFFSLPLKEGSGSRVFQSIYLLSLSVHYFQPDKCYKCGKVHFFFSEAFRQRAIWKEGLIFMRSIRRS